MTTEQKTAQACAGKRVRFFQVESRRKNESGIKLWAVVVDGKIQAITDNPMELIL